MKVLRTYLALALFALACPAVCPAQRGLQNVIQFFMPDGSQLNGVLRFTLTRDDGRVESLFTDSKGKYTMPNDLAKAAGYTVFVEGDRRTYDPTTYTFNINRTGDFNYFTVFLRPYKPPRAPRAGVVDAAALDANVPENARAAYKEGTELILKGQSAEGIESLKRAVTLYPKYLRALNDLGVAYMQLDKLEEAADAFARALKVDGRFALARLNLGITLNRQGRHAEAASVLGDLFKENPALPGARVNYCDALYDAGRPAEAEKLLRAGLDDEQLNNEEKAGLHYRLGRALSREGKLTDAIKELKSAADLEPAAYNAHLLLGGDLLSLKRPAEAERELLRAYELGGKLAGHAQLMLGQLYFDERKYDQALRAFEQYLSDVPDAQNATQIREVVAKLKSPTPDK